MYRTIRKISRHFSSVTCQNYAESKKLSKFSFITRSITNEDITGVVEIARENFFQFPQSYLKYWSVHDPDGVRVAINEAGKVVGVCSTVKVSEDLYFGGALIVHEKNRDADIGKKLTKECYDHAGDDNIGINCNHTKIGLFQRRNIKNLETDWKSLEYEVYYKVNPSVLSDDLPAGVEIVPYQPSYLEAILTFDRTIVAFDRRSFIEASCNEKDGGETLIAMKDGRCVGFGSIKLTILGLGRVGPLYADDASIAEVMMKRLILSMPNVKGFTIVTISSNILGNMMLEKLQIPVHDNIYRLYKNERVKVDTNKVFAHFDIDFSIF